MNLPALIAAAGVVAGAMIALRGILAPAGRPRAGWLAVGGAAVVGASLFLLSHLRGGSSDLLAGEMAPLLIWVALPGTIGAGLRGAAVLAQRSRRVTSARATASAADPEDAAADALPQPVPHARTEISFAGPSPELADEAAASQPPTATHQAAGGRRKPARADPPRESYAHLACDDVVVADTVVEVSVGLQAESDPAVAGGPLRRPEHGHGPWLLTVSLVADGFDLAGPEERWQVSLEVTAEAPYPVTSVRLRPRRPDTPVAARTVRAMYAADGQPIGFAVRAVAVVQHAELLTSTPAPAPQPAAPLAPPTADAPADLTVRIELGDGPAPGRLLWQLMAADGSVVVPAEPFVVDIGDDPAGFLRMVIGHMIDAEGSPTMTRTLRGLGRLISEQLPAVFWEVLAAVAATVPGRVPSVLLLSAEPYVPWELALMEQPLDGTAPPYLSAQVDVGRWVLAPQRPRLPPPQAVTARSMAVVSGVYDQDPGWQRLVEAEAEAAELSKQYGAAAVDATTVDVLGLLDGDPAADVLHFAVHGQYDPNGAQDGLVLLDGPLDPIQVTGADLPSHPFVFLNACQVGSGSAVLGDYAGMARAFLAAGASGVVAPLWSIDDVIARQLAVRFYERTLAGMPPAQALREERRAFQDAPAGGSSTMLAYQLFGHPRMRIDGAALLARRP